MIFNSSINLYANPENRCRIKKCLCKVRGDVGKNKFPSIQKFKNIDTQLNNGNDPRNKSVNKKLTVYFEFDKSNVNKNDKIDIYKYIKANNFAGGFFLDGHASSKGNRSYNQKLSKKRVAQVSKQISNILTRPIRIRAESYGERYSSSKDSSYDRNVTITPLNNFIELLDFKKTNYYLIDQSGSMKKYWSQIQNYKFWSRSVNVYLSTVNYCHGGTHLKEINSYGGTHIWYSFWNLIDEMRPGSSVTIVSDFMTPVLLSEKNWERIKLKLSSKNIKMKDVHFVQIKGAPVFYQFTK